MGFYSKTKEALYSVGVAIFLGVMTGGVAYFISPQVDTAFFIAAGVMIAYLYFRFSDDDSKQEQVG